MDGAGNERRITPKAVGVYSLLSGLPEPQRQWISARFTAQSISTWTQPIKLIGAASGIPTTCIRCTIGYDPADDDTQRQDVRIRSAPDWTHVELAETHVAPFTAPEAVATILHQRTLH